ncbi:hypothetical protein OQA88_2436 [Cercophora sp. LCS_1]
MSFSLPLQLTIVFIANTIYNLYLHPLRHYPGPRLYAASHLPYTINWINGSLLNEISVLHTQYGPVVRVAPNRLSYTDPSAWHSIRGHRKAGEGENGKEFSFYASAINNILGASRSSHSRFRRLLANGFSTKSMQLQQPLITGYVDLLLERLKGKEVVDIVSWFNYTTFDIIGDLSFGQPFGCLERSETHPWVEIIFASVGQFGVVVSMRRHVPFVLSFIRTVFPGSIGKPIVEQAKYARRQVDKRLESGGERRDFIDSMVKTSGDKELLTREEIAENARMLVLAGSETTATALSGTVYLLAKHKEVQKKLAEEVRREFKTEEDIDLFSVQRLGYMLAVLDESMRVIPPVPSSLPRVCQRGGDVIAGKWVPEGTGLDIFPTAMFRSEDNFIDADKFLPERWFEDKSRDKRFAKDKRDAFEPFSVGPRNCIGKNLAYVEMRLIMARLMWNFDFEFADEEAVGWLARCKGFNLWYKGPLNIRLLKRT